MESAIDYCIGHGILEDILSEHRAEVIAVFLTEYDAQAHMEMEREEWTEKGREEGREIQVVNLVRKKMEKGMSEEDIAEILEIDAGRVAQVCRRIRENPEWDDLKVCEELLK